jgi:putative hydrolase of the HAD superfamily
MDENEPPNEKRTAMNHSAVIFDRDNTLTQIDATLNAARMAQLAAIAPAIPAGAVMRHWAAWKGPWPRTPADEPSFWWAFWNALAPRYALSADVVQALQQASIPYHTSFAAFPDALDCVRTLRAQGMRLAVLTNFQLPSVALTLQQAGIDPRWFATLVSSVMLGVAKPDPHAYLAVADALELPARACVFVDDILENVQGACAVGMRGVWLDRQSAALHAPVERIPDLRCLGALMAGD